MQKNFDQWNKYKKNLDKHKVRTFCNEREIWFCHLGANIGFEQDGGSKEFLRPVIILKKFNNQTCWVLPLTKSSKKGLYYFPINFKGDKESRVIMSQIRMIDVKRLKYKAGRIENSKFKEIKNRLIKFLS